MPYLSVRIGNAEELTTSLRNFLNQIEEVEGGEGYVVVFTTFYFEDERVNSNYNQTKKHKVIAKVACTANNPTSSDCIEFVVREYNLFRAFKYREDAVKMHRELKSGLGELLKEFPENMEELPGKFDIIGDFADGKP